MLRRWKRALTRTASGPFQLQDAVPLDDVRRAAGEGSEQLAALLRPIDAGLEHLVSVTVNEDELPAFARGQHIRLRGGLPVSGADPIRVLGPDGVLVGIGRAADGRLAPDKVLVQP